jgi:NADPH:quinone reductase-like Zn-dependent oxidoreductase
MSLLIAITSSDINSISTMATANGPPSTMRGWAFRTRGPATSVIHLESDLPAPPVPAGSHLRIKVSHSSLTPSMAHLTYLIPSLPFLSRPYVPELDFAGVVDLAGPDAPAALGPGARVFGSVPLPDYVLRGRGSMAECILVPASEVAVLPEAAGFGLAEGSALNGNGQTALLMVRNAGIKKGSRVFVNGGSGGVGTLAVQIAKAEGAYVVATGSGENAELVKSLGADEVRTSAILHSLLTVQRLLITVCTPHSTRILRRSILQSPSMLFWIRLECRCYTITVPRTLS